MKGSNRSYLVILAVNGLSLLFSSSINVGLSIYFFESTGNASFMASVVAVHYGALIYSSLFAGYLVQQWTPLRVLPWSNAALGISSLVLFALLAADFRSLPSAAFIGISAVSGFLEGLSSLALMAATVQFIDKEDLLRWSGLIGVSENSPMLIGPILGAFLYSLGLLQHAAIFDAASFFATSVVVWLNRGDAGPVERSVSPKGVRGIWAGTSMILQHRTLRRIQLSYTALNFSNGLVAGILAYYILSSAQFPKSALAASNTSMIIGLLLGSVVLAQAASRMKSDRWVVTGLSIGALSRALLSLSTSLLAVVVSSLLRGFGNQMGNSAVMSIYQSSIRPAEQPNFFGARRFLSQGLYPAAVALSGVLVMAGVSRWGSSFTAWYIFSIALLEGALVALLYSSHALRDLMDLEEVGTTDEPSTRRR